MAKKRSAAPAFEVPRTYLGFEIIQLAHLKKIRDDALFRESVGIGLTQFRLLSLLSMAPGLGAGQLARWLLITPQSTATLIIELWKLGLVSKDAGRKRGARVSVSLTPKGRALFRRAQKALQQTRRETRAVFSDAELAMFQQLINRLNDHYKRLLRQQRS